MNATDPATIDWWIAFNRIEPIGREWHRSAGIMQQLALLRYESCIRDQRDPGQLEEVISLAAHMPPEWSPPKRTNQYLSPEEEQARARALAQR
jgi:hypothetical protein